MHNVIYFFENMGYAIHNVCYDPSFQLEISIFTSIGIILLSRNSTGYWKRTQFCFVVS